MFKIIGKINTVDGLVVPFVREDLSKFRSYIETCKCDICNSNRQRSDLFIIRLENGKELVAGRGCLDKLYGKETVSVAYGEAKEEAKKISFNCLDTEFLVNASADIIKQCGFVSVSEAKEHDFVATAEHLKQFKGIPESNIFEEVKAYFLSLEATNDFIANCQSIVSNDWTSNRAFSFVPAIVNSYFKEMERRAEQMKFEAIAKNSKFFEQDKFKGSMKVTQIACVKYEGYSYSYYSSGMRFRSYLLTEDGEVLVWDSNRKFWNEAKEIPEHVQDGESFELKSFSVKTRFESKKYGKVTQIIRPKY